MRAGMCAWEGALHSQMAYKQTDNLLWCGLTLGGTWGRLLKWPWMCHQRIMPLSGSGPSAAPHRSMRGASLSFRRVKALNWIRPSLRKIKVCLLLGYSLFLIQFWMMYGNQNMCASFITQVLASAHNVRLLWNPTFFCLYRLSFKVSYHHRGRCGHSIMSVGGSLSAWPITLSVPKAVVKRLIDVIQSPIPSSLSQLRLFPVLLSGPSLLQPPATETLMTSLTPNPSVGNYNICRHEKAAHKDGPGTGVTLPPPRLCLGSGCGGGATQSCWGRVGGRGGGDHFVQ